jgi:hypothetical protein
LSGCTSAASCAFACDWANLTDSAICGAAAASLDLLQSGNPINPHGVGHLGRVPWDRALSNTRSQAGQHIIQPPGLRIN